MSGDGRTGEHPDDLLSAHVDGELDADTAAQVEAHLAGCPACRAAEAELSEARALLRSLPTVDATPVIEGFLSRHRALIRLGAGFVGAASIVLLALGLTAATHHEDVVPDVERLVDAHVAGAVDDMDGVDRKEHSPYVAPAGLLGSAVSLSRHAVYDGADLGAAVYRDGALVLSVYQQPGRLDWDRLPPGRTEAVAGRPVWFRPGRPVVAVAEKGDLVVTVVSDDRRAVLTAVGGLPDWRRAGSWDRIHDACQRLTRAFALGG